MGGFLTARGAPITEGDYNGRRSFKNRGVNNEL